LIITAILKEKIKRKLRENSVLFLLGAILRNLSFVRISRNVQANLEMVFWVGFVCTCGRCRETEKTRKHVIYGC